MFVWLTLDAQTTSTICIVSIVTLCNGDSYIIISFIVAVIQRQHKQYGLLLDKQLKSLRQCASDYCLPIVCYMSERRMYNIRVLCTSSVPIYMLYLSVYLYYIIALTTIYNGCLLLHYIT